MGGHRADTCAWRQVSRGGRAPASDRRGIAGADSRFVRRPIDAPRRDERDEGQRLARGIARRSSRWRRRDAAIFSVSASKRPPWIGFPPGEEPGVGRASLAPLHACFPEFTTAIIPEETSRTGGEIGIRSGFRFRRRKA